MQQFAEAARDEAAFSMRVLRHLANFRDGGCRANLAVSPLSHHAAQALLAAGAGGGTLHEIANFLGPAGGSAHAALASYVALRVFADRGGEEGGGGTTTVRFANGVWVDADLQLKAPFARVAAEFYRAEARQAFFKTMPEEARSQINEWIASATAGRIKDLLPTGCIHPGTPADLANALYFKGAWERKFDAGLTRDDTFFLHDGRVVRVPFMSSTSKQCVACRPCYKVLRLRYAQQGGGGEHRVFSMYIYLPDVRDGLPALLHKLSANPAQLLESSRTLSDEVPVRAFRVPRFTVAYRTKARETLLDLGLRLPFDRVAADFGDMVEAAPEPLVVSDVYHESFVEVNEQGTEAAAATAVAMGFGCARVEAPVDFVADHPFVFLIKEFTGVVVFAGQVIVPSNPTVGSTTRTRLGFSPPLPAVL